jgi:hypothetical protein
MIDGMNASHLINNSALVIHVCLQNGISKRMIKGGDAMACRISPKVRRFGIS